MTPQEYNRKKAAEVFANNNAGTGSNRVWYAYHDGYLAGQQWQSEQDNQALSSALKEIEELNRWKKEMLQLWNKLDAYIETRKDIRLGESKVDFAIKVMKEHEKMKEQLKQHLPEECIERYAEVKFCSIRNGDGWQCKECAND